MKVKAQKQTRTLERTMKLATAISVTILGLALAVPMASAPAQELTKLRMTIPVTSLTFYPVFVAQDKGFFKKQGVDFEIVVTQAQPPDVVRLAVAEVQPAEHQPFRLGVQRPQLLDRVANQRIALDKACGRTSGGPRVALPGEHVRPCAHRVDPLVDAIDDPLLAFDGPIAFDERGQNKNATVIVMQVQGDNVEQVFPQEVATKDLVFPAAPAR